MNEWHCSMVKNKAIGGEQWDKSIVYPVEGMDWRKKSFVQW
jgi:hypothetical protein